MITMIVTTMCSRATRVAYHRESVSRESVSGGVVRQIKETTSRLRMKEK